MTSGNSFICLRREEETICLSGSPTADGWRGFLIAVQLDGWPIILPPPGREADFPAGEWMEVYPCGFCVRVRAEAAAVGAGIGGVKGMIDRTHA